MFQNINHEIRIPIKKSIALWGCLICLIPSIALATEDNSKIDRNKDGIIDWQEYKDAFEQKLKINFDKIDINHDNKITKTELEQYKKEQDSKKSSLWGK